jgi:hypothetical protein
MDNSHQPMNRKTIKESGKGFRIDKLYDGREVSPILRRSLVQL